MTKTVHFLYLNFRRIVNPMFCPIQIQSLFGRWRSCRSDRPVYVYSAVFVGKRLRPYSVHFAHTLCFHFLSDSLEFAKSQFVCEGEHNMDSTSLKLEALPSQIFLRLGGATGVVQPAE